MECWVVSCAFEHCMQGPVSTCQGLPRLALACKGRNQRGTSHSKTFTGLQQTLAGTPNRPAGVLTHTA
eukprot:9348764-Alexandrium_andersonii.AAC.1